MLPTSGLGLLPLAFAAGMLSAINPCGLVLLPAYISHAVSALPTGDLLGRLSQGLRAGGILTAGFAGSLTMIGLLVAAGAYALLSAAPWLAVASGVVLAVLGVATLAGRRLGVRVPVPARAGASPSTSAGRLLLLGAGSGIATLSCSFGILLSVISQALAAADLVAFLGVFAAYALGAATILMVLSVTTASAGGLFARLARRIRPLGAAMPAITGVMLLLTAGYLVAYWLPVATGSGSPPAVTLWISELSSAAAAWVATHQLLVVAVAAALLGAAALAVTLARPGRQPDRQTTRVTRAGATSGARK